MTERIGIVDMGSGTARLVVYQYEPGHWFKLYADYAGAIKLGRLEVIATSAVREAANSQDFLSRTAGLNLEFKVLSGEDEARYGALAVANSFVFPNCWVMDLGCFWMPVYRLKLCKKR